MTLDFWNVLYREALIESSVDFSLSINPEPSSNHGNFALKFYGLWNHITFKIPNKLFNSANLHCIWGKNVTKTQNKHPKTVYILTFRQNQVLFAWKCFHILGQLCTHGVLFGHDFHLTNYTIINLKKKTKLLKIT